MSTLKNCKFLPTYKRLDAMVSVSGDALTAAKTMIKDLLPLRRALTYKDQESFELCKGQATADRYEKYIERYKTSRVQNIYRMMNSQPRQNYIGLR